MITEFFVLKNRLLNNLKFSGYVVFLYWITFFSGTGSLPLKTAIKTLQPRVVTSTKSPMPSGTASKPSVIVVQRSHGGSAKAALVTKEGIPASVVGGQRILQTKTKQQPIVIVSKPSSTGPIEQITTSTTTKTEPAATAVVASTPPQPPTSSNQVH